MPVSLPLVVDLDNTLVRTDLLIESVLALLRKHPLYLFVLPLWLIRGKARFKHEVARLVSLDMNTLPWRIPVTAWLTRQRGEGRSLVLATGSDVRIATQAAEHLTLFDTVFASDGNTNLCGEAKRQLLVSRFGENGFDYAADGGGRRDVPVWASARKAILVHSGGRLRSIVGRTAAFDQVFSETRTGIAGYLKVLRPAHWLKNLLIFVTLIAGHRFDDAALLTRSVLAFVAFGCCASAGYLLNDLIDLEADRHHPTKRLRPFAAGELPLGYALLMAPALLLAGCLLGALVSTPLLGILLVYFAMSASYSLRLKQVAVLDVLFLAGLYAIRIMAGSAAVGIGPSPWLLAFSIFLFFSLALAKRYGELVIMQQVDGRAAKARAYELSDAELLAAMGVASGYLAVMVLAIYIAMDQGRLLYDRPDLLWFLCPLLLYWISHVWLISHRGKMDHDPVVFATRDRTSQILAILMALTTILAV